MGSNQFCLKWRRHPSDEKAALELAPYDEGPGNVSLMCGGSFLNVHKTVLSAFSPFFREQFAAVPARETIVIPKGVRCGDLETLVEFMYHGEVVVQKGQLPSLLKAAEALKVKGRLVFTRTGRPEGRRRKLANLYVADGTVASEPHGDLAPHKRQFNGLPQFTSSRVNRNDSLHLSTPSTSRILHSQHGTFPRAANLPSDHRTTFAILENSGTTTSKALPSSVSICSSNNAEFVENTVKSSFVSPRAAESVTNGVSEGQNAHPVASSKTACEGSSSATQTKRPQNSNPKHDTDEQVYRSVEEATIPSSSEAQNPRQAVTKEAKEAVGHRPVTRSMTTR